MSTSVMIAHEDPNRVQQCYSFSRNACFGDTNRLSSQLTRTMDVMEWHPQMAGQQNASSSGQYRTPRKAFEFINSFGCWEDVFHMTPMRSVAAFVKENPADCMITGFMTMRDYQECANPKCFDNESRVGAKIEHALCVAGIYRDRYGNANSPLQIMGNVSYGEHGTTYLRQNDDAFGLYLLVYGTKADFEGCWAQGIIGVDRENLEGYIRNSSNTDRVNAVRARRPGWGNMADWLWTWLRTNPEQHTGKLGRLTVRQFYDRLAQRLNGVSGQEAQAAVVTAMFEELRDMYS